MRELLRTICSALLTTCLAITAAACGDGSSCPDPRTCDGATSRVADLPPLTATVTPAWDEPSATMASPPESPDRVEIHLDISSPMAGYLPPGGDGDLSVFQLVAQNAAQHMARVFGGADAPVRWVGVGHEMQDLGARPQIERGVFDGRSTQLDQSMERMLGDFRAGRAEAAALVSDLMATGDVTGPLTLFGALDAWLRSPDVRSGAFHVGLFGVKADYWGARVRGCTARAPFGCRFDELRRRWVALEAVQQTPVYVLVLGRGAGRVRSVLESLQATVDELNVDADTQIETQRELLTDAVLPRDAAIRCQAGDDERDPQYALFSTEQQQYCCVRDDTVTLFCVVEDGFEPTAARATWVETAAEDPPASGPAAETQTAESETGEVDDAGASAVATALPPAADARIVGTDIVFDFACSSVRCGPSARAGLELLIDATGTVVDASADDRGGARDDDGRGGRDDWDDWSTETGEVGRTLQLRGFVDAVRIVPDRYELRTPAILRFPGR